MEWLTQPVEAWMLVVVCIGTFVLFFFLLLRQNLWFDLLEGRIGGKLCGEHYDIYRRNDNKVVENLALDVSRLANRVATLENVEPVASNDEAIDSLQEQINELSGEVWDVAADITDMKTPRWKKWLRRVLLGD